jgi:hypothetical protein
MFTEVSRGLGEVLAIAGAILDGIGFTDNSMIPKEL